MRARRPDTVVRERRAAALRQARYVSSRTCLRQTSAPTEPPEFGMKNRKVEYPRGESFMSKSINVDVPEYGIRKLYSFWLRDHCQCKECAHPETKQRLVDPTLLDSGLQPWTHEATEDGLHVTWLPEDHQSFYSWDWVKRHINATGGPKIKMKPKRLAPTFVPKDPSKFPSVEYAKIMGSEAGVQEWTAKILQYGFCFVDGCPAEPEATQSILERISFIRSTHYGGFWDFTSDLSSKDMAYTSLALNVHTDTAYFTDPAGLQMFHLLSHTDGTGGSSILVDGFRAAELLLQENPQHYKTLSTTPIRWHASGNQDISIQSDPFPVLGLHPVTKELIQVRWNNEDRASLKDDVPVWNNWYSASIAFDKILRRDELRLEFQLEPGRPLIFDNWRMLHGRTAFIGKRRMCGGYINHDDFMSRYRMTNIGREEVLLDL